MRVPTDASLLQGPVDPGLWGWALELRSRGPCPHPQGSEDALVSSTLAPGIHPPPCVGHMALLCPSLELSALTSLCCPLKQAKYFLQDL